MDPAELEALRAKCLLVAPVGSRVTCDPAPTDTDEDYLLLVRSLARARTGLEAQGYVTTSEQGFYGSDGSTFLSFRKGEINLIVTADGDFYTRFSAATHVAKKLNLLRKEDRVSLFQAVLYGNVA